jgi:SAM-dependent methyltransferase
MENSPENNKKEYGWKEYYERHAYLPHTKSLEKAVEEYVTGEKVALDIGAGNLRDTKYLLSQGFTVTALDSSPASTEIATALHNPELVMIEKLIRDYEFPENKFSLVNAQGILFHLPIDRLITNIDKIRKSLKEKGVFVTELLGPHDDWNISGTDKTFLTREQLKELLKDFEIEYLDEYERDMTSDASEVTGTHELKHWHKFKIIAVKK